MPASETGTAGLSFHALSAEQTLKALSSTPRGITSKEAVKRLERYGLNQLQLSSTVSRWRILQNQFRSFLIYLLAAAAVLTLLIGELYDTLAITLIILINTGLGYIQEYKAQSTLQALKELQSPTAKVWRDSELVVLPANQVVPGDCISLVEGDRVPADARIITAHSFQVDESALTGESQPVSKKTSVVASETNMADRLNTVFAGTSVVRGKAIAVVFATAQQTEVGNIAQLVQQPDPTQDTPLQKTLSRLAKVLGAASLAIALVGLTVGLATGRPFTSMFLLTISLVVSSIPEGLPIVVTITLALGAQKMAKKQVLVKRLPAVETLGSVDVICTDKTGTLTKNKMQAVEMARYIGGSSLSTLTLTEKQETLTKKAHTVWQPLLLCGLLCNDADETTGDPTERALLDLALAQALPIKLRDDWTRIDEVPFNSDQKLMATLHQVPQKKHLAAFVKGAPETLISLCRSVAAGKTVQKMTQAKKAQVHAMVDDMSGRGLRVLALATRDFKNSPPSKLSNQVSELTFLGLVGLLDPPRPEVAQALLQCHTAGIRVIMITGDHPLTAKAVGSQIGLTAQNNTIVTGQELEIMDRDELERAVQETAIFARVSPLHKLRILRALQNQGHLVAMTGDGVNDAPALKEAEIGIAVGSGTDLAKEVSDMILMDDNFASIVAAVEQARGIFSNIKKFVAFLISANVGEVFLLLATLTLNTPLPLLPIHLLWINVITDSLPALALSVDTFEPDLMSQPPKRPEREILNGVLRFSAAVGWLAFLSTFGVFVYSYYGRAWPLEYVQTLVFTVMVLFELGVVFSARSMKSAFSLGLFSNKWLLLAVTGSTLLQLLAVYLPATHHIFDTVPIALRHWPFVIAISASGFVLIEVLRAIKYSFWPQLKLRLLSRQLANVESL